MQHKHLKAMPLPSESLDAYSVPLPEQTLLDLAMDKVATVVRNMSGGSDTGGTNLVEPKNWLM